MDLVEDRSPEFWDRIANHPEVAPHVFLGGASLPLAEIVQHPSVTPLRAQNGGFLFWQLDGIGRQFELHTLFTPAGWGREVNQAAKQAFARMFASGAQLVTTYEVEGWRRSQPPKSFGFQPAGDFAPSPFGSLRTWILTADAWAGSPACRRME